MSDAETVIAILGLACITVLTRGFFLLPKREIPLPAWFREGLRYAPLAALAAIIAPDLFMKDGALIHTLKDARLYGAAAGVAYFAWRRGLLGTIITGLAVFFALRFSVGW